MTDADISKLIAAAFEFRKTSETAGDILSRISAETGVDYERVKDVWLDDMGPVN